MAVEEGGEGVECSTGRARGEVKNVAPQAEVRAPGQRLRRNEREEGHRRCEDKNPRNALREQSHILLLSKRVAFRIRQLVHDNQNEIDNRPDATATKRYKLKDTKASISKIDAVDTSHTDQEEK